MSQHNVPLTTSGICFWRFDSNDSTMPFFFFSHIESSHLINSGMTGWCSHASMDHPNPHLSVTWNCIMHENFPSFKPTAANKLGIGRTPLFPLSSPSLLVLSLLSVSFCITSVFALVPHLFHTTCVPQPVFLPPPPPPPPPPSPLVWCLNFSLSLLSKSALASPSHSLREAYI